MKVKTGLLATHILQGDGFRAYADYVYDEDEKLQNPERVSEGQVVFLNTDFIKEYFSKIHPKIENRYILISHNSDVDIPGDFAKYLDDDKLIAWFWTKCL